MPPRRRTSAFTRAGGRPSHGRSLRRRMSPSVYRKFHHIGNVMILVNDAATLYVALEAVNAVEDDDDTSRALDGRGDRRLD